MAKPVFFGVTPEFLTHEGLAETIQPWEDGLRADTGPGSFEWWYFDAHFSDQSTAVIVFSTKPILERNGPLKPNVLFTITGPNGVKRSNFPTFPTNQFHAAKENCAVRIGPNWVQGNLHSYQVHVEIEGSPTENLDESTTDSGHMSADLTFTGLVPPWRPGAGKAFFGDLEHYFGWLPSIPYGKVQGTLTYEGQSHQVYGTGYHDHNWGNIGLNDVMDHWYWGRAHVNDYTLIYVEQVAAKKYGYARIPVFMLAKGNQIITGDGANLIMRAADFVEHPGGRSYPREVDFHWQDGDESAELSLRGPRLIEATSLLLTLPAWQRAFIRLFANPYYFRFNAELILSIHKDGHHLTEHGPALFEIMILQGKKHP
jgi:predicted secreted hydrolase